MEETDIYENPSSEIYETRDHNPEWAGSNAVSEVPFHIPRD